MDGRHFTFEDTLDDDGDPIENAEDFADPMLLQAGSSVFFPTFRRIEGGFTLTSTRPVSQPRNLLTSTQARRRSDIEESLSGLAKKLTNGKHSFVSAISTADIVGLLLTRLADLSSESNDLQQITSDDVIRTIKDYKSDKDDVQQIEVANRILEQIRGKIEDMEFKRQAIMSPISEVQSQVTKLIKHTGIQFGNKLSFGDTAKTVNSDALSAGEKQLLSFLCYNAFNEESVIIIDEPELSLHVDWQRTLFPTLLKQQSSNQFIIATHSPFIYGKYPDKEILLDQNRGDTEV